MAKKKKKQKKIRSEPPTTQTIWLSQLESLVGSGYTTLANTPEVQIGVERVAELIGNMTIHLMQNTENGDIRIKNGLSRKIDIEPHSLTTRQIWMQSIVKNLFLNGNAVIVPRYHHGLLEDLPPLDIASVNFTDTEDGYKIDYGGTVYDYDEIVHFRLNPYPNRSWIGRGYKVYLREVVKQINQATATTTDFMENKMMPSVIIKVDAMTEELTTKDGRAEVYDNYISATRAGEPWIVPMDLFDVKEIKPLTLNDIAIKDTVQLSKQTVAAILGVPSFLLGVGTFNKEEYNHFIRTRVLTIAKAIEQELTKKLLYSPDLYFKFNIKSLYAYDMKEMAAVGKSLYVSGVMTGNEVRDFMNLTPRDGLDELVILENFIPLDKIATQNKLNGGEEGE